MPGRHRSRARMAVGWDEGDGPTVWLACPPRELHDLPLLAYGLLRRERGWRVRFFGAPAAATASGSRIFAR